MTDFNIVVENLEPNILVIETSVIDNLGIVEIEKFSAPSVSILGPSAIINLSDLPDIPFSKIIGNLDVARVEGLANYLDQYNFDCGTP